MWNKYELVQVRSYSGKTKMGVWPAVSSMQMLLCVQQWRSGIRMSWLMLLYQIYGHEETVDVLVADPC